MHISAILMAFFVHRTVWLLSPPIRTTFATGVLITTLLHPLLTQTACGLCTHSSSSHILCSPPHATRGSHHRYTEEIALNMVFFSAFEDLRLRINGTTESNGIGKLYEPSPVPTLCWVEDLLGWVPLFPCFLDGNTTSTIQYKYAGRQKQAFEFWCFDGQGPASSRGSHVYEINDWLWSFGRPQPRIGGLSVAKMERISRKSRSETSRHAWETRKARTMAAEEI
jgi:hypothetical protein